jgi:hypothetical protein
VDNWIASNPTRTISQFGLMNDNIWTGVTPDFLAARFVEGGFTRYQALQASLRGSRDILGPLRNFYYEAGYALSRSEASDTSTKPEMLFFTSLLNNHNWNSRDDFGPTSLDQTHRLTAVSSFSLPGGFRIGSIWTFRTPSAVSIFIPIQSAALTGSNGRFGDDLNGDNIPDLLPGLGAGQFGRKVKSFATLNHVIGNFNSAYGGTLSAYGQALVNAGLFTESQLQRLGATVSPIPLVPLTNPNPWHNVFNTDLSLERPVRLERFQFGPCVQVFNLFNHAPAGLYSGLGGTFGALNFDYTKAVPGQRASDLNSNARGRNTSTRALRVGVRLQF